MSPSSNPAVTAADAEALVRAAHEGNSEKVRELLVRGVPVDARDSESYLLGLCSEITALMCAARMGHVEIVRALLAAGAQVSAASKADPADGGGGSQALHFAMIEHHPEVVNALLDAGADPNALGNSGRTPLTVAIFEKNMAGARQLLQRGADPKLKPKKPDYEPPLYAVASILTNTTSLVARNKKLVREVEELWEHKAEVMELFTELLAAGADPNMPIKRGGTPLMRLAGGDDIPDDVRLPFVEKLLAAGADTNKQDWKGSTALLKGVFYHNSSTTRLLCQANADVNALSERGTALDVAEQGAERCKKDLKDPALKDAWRVNMEKQLQQWQEIIQLLRERGGKRKSELGPAPAAGPAKPKAAGTKEAATGPGATDFLKFIHDGEAEWSLLAVKAPFEKAAEAFAKFSKAKERIRDVAVKPAAGEGDELARLVAVVQIRGNPWTVILRSLFHVEEEAMAEVEQAAKELSKKLKTQAISFVAEDTSGAVGYELFDKGRSRERAVWEDGARFSSFESNHRDEPELETVDESFADEVFRDLGIYLPACYPKTTGKSSWLAVEKASAGRIERADLISP